jgi:hypothetical protein
MFLAQAEPEAPQAVEPPQTSIMVQPWPALPLVPAAAAPVIMAAMAVAVVPAAAAAGLRDTPPPEPAVPVVVEFLFYNSMVPPQLF